MKNNEEKERLLSLRNELFVCCNDVQRFIFTLTYDNYAKEEVFQNTVVRAYEGLGQLDEHNKMLPWLFEIAKTETARHYRKEKRWKRFKEVDFEEMKEEGIAEDLILMLEGVKKKSDVVELMNRLRPRYARIVRAHYLYHVSLADLARIWGINYNTIKTYHYRALKDLRDLFCKEWQDEAGEKSL